MSKVKDFLEQHLLIVLLACLGVIIVIIGIVSLWPRSNANLIVSVAPVDASIEINGKKYENGMFRGMAPGHYVAVISQAGFEDKTVELELENNKVAYLNEYLTQIGGGFNYYETDNRSMLVLREYLESHKEDEKLKDFLESYDKKKAILEDLPLEFDNELTGGRYYIDYLENDSMCEKNYCLTISASNETYMEMALNALRDKGYSIEDYEIINFSDGGD